jgi:hypothetical protein
MALFGRETAAEQQRAERIKAWVQARSPFALFSVMCGILAVFDFFTLVLGVMLGIIAIVLAVLGRREIRRKPELLGAKLCLTGALLGTLGLCLSLLFFIWSVWGHRP